MINYADVIVDLQCGDTGKGKIANYLASKENEYSHVVRYNGGGNAGHTIYYEGKKIVTHFIPVGVVHGIKSIIGPGCVVNVKLLLEEIEYLESNGINVRDFLYVDKRVHIITEEHIKEESDESKIGTTKKGNGPAYRDKYGREGIRAGEIEELKDFVIDIYEEFYGFNSNPKILFEGAQGFELDIDWGDYPYVTSSHCTVGSACLNGVPPNKIRNVYGICKPYSTYVGSKKFEGDDEVFEKIREVGNEYGSTTGRPRQVNWVNINTLIMAININGVTDLIVNKVDVLEKVGVFKYYYNEELIEFKSFDDFWEFFKFNIYISTDVKNITYSESALTL